MAAASCAHVLLEPGASPINRPGGEIDSSGLFLMMIPDDPDALPVRANMGEGALGENAILVASV